jgi:hypothetical protein
MMRPRNDRLANVMRTTRPTPLLTNSLAAKKFHRQREKTGQIALKPGSMHNLLRVVGYRL